MIKPGIQEFLDSPLGRELTREQLHQELTAQSHWQGRYRIIMKLGSRMPALAPQWQREDAEVAGCESKAWLYHHRDEQGQHHFLADSESRIIKGLLVLILSTCNHSSDQTIRDLDLDSWFSELGLSAHLSPSRANGVAALVAAIRTRASAPQPG
ncbi:SufE family protein [Ferrimonas sediminicola]|uniref:SufE family protein n=1 Tax=Ferrimonas sediminicola TaxID=2569538 RepID=A0A4U1BJH7_9GAMM|nr:SufE family protein [Ferrimonas sediminicola]TKB51325.1 SufE family protein [Ferrimonas sediminicola]